MRAGKLFRIKSPTSFWPTVIGDANNPKCRVRTNVIVLVIDTKPENYKSVCNFYDLHIPWLVLAEDRAELIDIDNKKLLDVTPFRDENEEFYILDYFLE